MLTVLREWPAAGRCTSRGTSRSSSTSRRASGSSGPASSPWTAGIGITVHGTFIVGLPGEKPAIQETIRFAKEINPHRLQVSIAAPYPGTALYQQAKENGWAARRRRRVDEHGVQAAAIRPEPQPDGDLRLRSRPFTGSSTSGAEASRELLRCCAALGHAAVACAREPSSSQPPAPAWSRRRALSAPGGQGPRSSGGAHDAPLRRLLPGHAAQLAAVRRSGTDGADRASHDALRPPGCSPSMSARGKYPRCGSRGAVPSSPGRPRCRAAGPCATSSADRGAPPSPAQPWVNCQSSRPVTDTRAGSRWRRR